MLAVLLLAGCAAPAPDDDQAQGPAATARPHAGPYVRSLDVLGVAADRAMVVLALWPREAGPVTAEVRGDIRSQAPSACLVEDLAGPVDVDSIAAWREGGRLVFGPERWWLGSKGFTGGPTLVVDSEQAVPLGGMTSSGDLAHTWRLAEGEGLAYIVTMDGAFEGTWALDFSVDVAAEVVAVVPARCGVGFMSLDGAGVVWDRQDGGSWSSRSGEGWRFETDDVPPANAGQRRDAAATVGGMRHGIASGLRLRSTEPDFALDVVAWDGVGPAWLAVGAPYGSTLGPVE